MKRIERVCSACLACLGRTTNVLQNFEIFYTSGTRLSHALMCDCKSELKEQINKLILYVQNLQRVEIFHTPGARLGYTLLCDCCLSEMRAERVEKIANSKYA